MRREHNGLPGLVDTEGLHKVVHNAPWPSDDYWKQFEVASGLIGWPVWPSPSDSQTSHATVSQTVSIRPRRGREARLSSSSASCPAVLRSVPSRLLSDTSSSAGTKACAKWSRGLPRTQSDRQRNQGGYTGGRRGGPRQCNWTVVASKDAAASSEGDGRGEAGNGRKGGVGDRGAVTCRGPFPSRYRSSPCDRLSRRQIGAQILRRGWPQSHADPDAVR